MAHMALQMLVGTALTDSRFCRDLLNGRRHTLLAEFDLTDGEREAILAIQADSIQAFAAQLGEWLEAQESVICCPPVAGVVQRPPLRSWVEPAFWQ